jgi:hypothetical protein
MEPQPPASREGNVTQFRRQRVTESGHNALVPANLQENRIGVRTAQEHLSMASRTATAATRQQGTTPKSIINARCLEEALAAIADPECIELDFVHYAHISDKEVDSLQVSFFIKNERFFWYHGVRKSVAVDGLHLIYNHRFEKPK